MALQVYGIPTCGTCKKALQWLDDRSIVYTFINTKDYPPSKPEIKEWVSALGAKPLRNTSGLSYRALGEEKQIWTDAEWIDAFSTDAMLIKRPLFVKDGTAIAVGFKQTSLEQILK